MNSIAKKILIGSLVTGGVGGAGYGGYKIGKRRGATDMASAMTKAFKEGNAAENQMIAEEFFNQGIQYGSGMAKKSNLTKTSAINPTLKNILIGAGVLTGGVGAYKIGKKRGASSMANELTQSFQEANIAENEQISDSYFKRGLIQGMDINKNASINLNQLKGDGMLNVDVFEKIAEEAFQNEMDSLTKEAAGIKDIIGKYTQSYKYLPEAKNTLLEYLRTFTKKGKKSPLGPGFKDARSEAAFALKQALKKSAPALGTIGFGLGAGGYGLHRAIND